MKIIDTKMNAFLYSWYIYSEVIFTYLLIQTLFNQSILLSRECTWSKISFWYIRMIRNITKAILFSIPDESTTFERSKERIRFEGLKKLSFYFCNLISVCSLTQSVKSAKKFSPKIWVAFWNIWDYFLP